MIGGGLGIGGIALTLLYLYLTNGQITPGDVLNMLPEQQTTQEDTSQYQGADSYEVFASTVLGSANDMWQAQLAKRNIEYEAPRLVLFRGSTDSACGGADSSVGPHYCPYDSTIYLDETFFDELKKLGGSGDVAQAYVIAHEAGHHGQQELGLLKEDETPAESVQTELQADCFAGLWAYSIKDKGVFEQNEIKEALDAAAAVGDDRIQSAFQGRVTPETWTHGSSEQRVAAFTNGYDSGELSACGVQ